MKRFIMVVCAALSCAAASAQDINTDFNIPREQEKDVISINGYFSGNFTGVVIPDYAPGFLTDFFGCDENKLTNIFHLDLVLTGEYATEYTGFFCRSVTDIRQDDPSFGFYEIYGRYSPSYNLCFRLGKIIHNWGKGYAFNAVGFINPVKDPRMPETLKEGILVLETQLLFGYASDLFTGWALDLVIIPGEMIADGGFDIENTDYAVKASFLIADMDIDLMGRYGSEGRHQVGGDVAFNLWENLEVHAEGAYAWNVPKIIFAGNSPQTGAVESVRFLFGARYLSPWNTTVILEYFHNSAGYSASEYGDLIQYIDDTMAAGSERQINILRRDFLPLLNKTGQMRNYLYLKLIQPEPFDLLYVTPAAAALLNLDDLSLCVSGSLSYKPVNNFELNVGPCFYCGGDCTEMGSKAVLFQIDVELFFYF